MCPFTVRLPLAQVSGFFLAPHTVSSPSCLRSSPLRSNIHFQSDDDLLKSVAKHIMRTKDSSGILTGYPSPTSFDLGLGSTDPEQTNFTQGNLRFSAEKIFTSLIATYSDILTSCSSSTPYGMPSVRQERSSTTPYYYGIHNFGNMLEPRVFSAQNHSTSELLRTL